MKMISFTVASFRRFASTTPSDIPTHVCSNIQQGCFKPQGDADMVCSNPQHQITLRHFWTEGFALNAIVMRRLRAKLTKSAATESVWDSSNAVVRGLVQRSGARQAGARQGGGCRERRPSLARAAPCA